MLADELVAVVVRPGCESAAGFPHARAVAHAVVLIVQADDHTVVGPQVPLARESVAGIVDDRRTGAIGVPDQRSAARGIVADRRSAAVWIVYAFNAVEGLVRVSEPLVR